MATIRIFQLAKELGVKSAAIIDKCLAEGVESIKGHQSTVSAGLEASIREWFSDTNTHTTVETAAPVDLDKVKAKPEPPKAEPEPKPSEAGAVGSEAGDAEGGVAVEAEPAADAPETGMLDKSGREKPKRLSPAELQKQELPCVEAPTETAPEPVAAAEAPEAVADAGDGAESPVPAEEPAVASSPEAAEEPPADIESAETDSAKGPQRSRPVPVNIVQTGKVRPVKPVQYIPKPAVLEGPKVIRTERPDNVPIPGSRPPRRERVDQQPAIPDSQSMKEGKGKKGKDNKNRSVTLSSAAAESDVKRKSRLLEKKKQRGDLASYGDRDLQERQERLASASGKGLHVRQRMSGGDRSAGGAFQRQKITAATLKEPITVKDLSAAIGVRAAEIIGRLMGQGIMATINQSIDNEAAESIAMEYDVELTIEKRKLRLDELKDQFDAMSQAAEKQLRPPIVAFLGHVDHGKTSLLDRIRRAKVASGEAGGITQHIGSYLYDDGKRRVTFLDTPGHKAFTEMRARGANMTDIVVLVVAADDGVMPQTEEAINHARAANVPIVVALNKVDMPNADINRALGQLAEKGLIAAEWGGDTEIVQTSAATGQGIDDLVEYLDYVAELNHLTSRPAGPATGWVVESEMSTARGALARLLIKEGTLKPGDSVVSGACYGRVRTIHDAFGKALTEAGPSTPIEVTGLNAIPIAGDAFYVVADSAEAAQIATEQQQHLRENTLARRRLITLENLFSEIAAGALRELNVIIKADVQGSIDVLRKSIMELNNAEVAVKVLHAAVGGISENDVVLASASNAIIIGFQVAADDHARALAEREKVEIRMYRVIYKITDEIKLALEGMLAPAVQEKTKGRVEVRQTFKISRLGTIAGCFVTEGLIGRSDKVRVIRDGVIIRDNSTIDTLKRVKDDASEVRTGFECGIKLAGFDDIKEGDIIEAYEFIEISRTLDSSRK